MRPKRANNRDCKVERILGVWDVGPIPVTGSFIMECQYKHFDSLPHSVCVCVHAPID